MADRFHVRTLETGEWDHEHASRHADIQMVAALIQLAQRKRKAELGKRYSLHNISDASYALVLLLLEGETQRALRYADALVSASRMPPFEQAPICFTSSFILEVLGDYLGRTPQRLVTPVYNDQAFKADTWFDALRHAWRTPDAAKIGGLLAAYDCHTQLSWSGRNFHQREFNNNLFTRTPFAALLVCKLRELEGLPNPELEHPLLDSALGRVPRPGYVPDPVIAKLTERIDKGGLDIGAALAFYPGESKRRGKK